MKKFFSGLLERALIVASLLIVFYIILGLSLGVSVSLKEFGKVMMFLIGVSTFAGLMSLMTEKISRIGNPIGIIMCSVGTSVLFVVLTTIFVSLTYNYDVVFDTINQLIIFSVGYAFVNGVMQSKKLSSTLFAEISFLLTLIGMACIPLGKAIAEELLMGASIVTGALVAYIIIRYIGYGIGLLYKKLK